MNPNRSDQSNIRRQKLDVDASPATYQFGVEVVGLQCIVKSARREEQAVKSDDDLVEASTASPPDVVKNEYGCCEQHAVRAHRTRSPPGSLPTSPKRSWG